MKSVARVTILSILIIASMAFGQTPAAPVRPQLNGLERGEAQRRKLSLKMAQQRLSIDQKQVAKATAALSTGTTAKEKTEAQKRLTMAQNLLDADTAAVPRTQARVDDWTATTLKVHNADSTKYKIDWQKGQVISQ